MIQGFIFLKKGVFSDFLIEIYGSCLRIFLKGENDYRVGRFDLKQSHSLKFAKRKLILNGRRKRCY